MLTAIIIYSILGILFIRSFTKLVIKLIERGDQNES